MFSATPLANGVDGAIRPLETAFDTAGRSYLFTSYDASSGGNIVNQVQRDFNGLSQLTKEYLSHSGAVNTGSTPKVQYAYSEMASGANHSRLTSMTYPNGTVITYDYGSAGGLHDKISRLDAIKDGSNTLEQYSYLGLGTVAEATRTALGAKLTFLDEVITNDDAGDIYLGYDRFGRITGMVWRKTSAGSGTILDVFLYGYDRDGNRLFRDIEITNAQDANAYDELYHANGSTQGYDSLNRLVEWRRGELTDSAGDGDDVPDTVTTASRYQIYTMDGQGNFSSVNTTGTSTSRTHNQQNEISTLGTATLTYDSNGNLTTDETGKTLVWDAWNRLRQVKSSGGSNIITFGIDALGRQVTEDTGTVRDMYYSPAWQLLEERTSGTARKEYVWGAMYVDEMIRRRRDTDNNGSLDETVYAFQDANGNVTTLAKKTGGNPEVLERYYPDPYGGNIVVLDEDWNVQSGSDYDWKNFHQGLRYESLIGLYANRAREYSPTLQTFVGNDPLGFAAGYTNLYVYVGNGPVSRVDPSGLFDARKFMGNLLEAELRIGVLIATRGAPSAMNMETSQRIAGGAAAQVGDTLTGLGQRLQAIAEENAKARGSFPEMLVRLAWRDAMAARNLSADLIANREKYATALVDAAENGDPLRGLGRVMVIAAEAYLTKRVTAGLGLSPVGGQCFRAPAWAPGLAQRSLDKVNYWLSRICFAPETRLLTPDGDKAICDFKPGDKILSAPEDDPTAPVEVQIVEEVFENYGSLLNLHVNGQVIRTTAEHPFYVLEKGWQPAGSLEPGDLLRSNDGSWVPVEEVMDSGEESVVYNLRVSEHHTYFVGSREWGFSAWAHNQYFSSFRELKRALGPAGPGRVWHHIVEKRLERIFGPKLIHNTTNVVNVTRTVNQAIANYYSRVRSFSNGLTVRRWLESQSFADQMAFGKRIMSMVLKGSPLP